MSTTISGRPAGIGDVGMLGAVGGLGATFVGLKVRDKIFSSAAPMLDRGNRAPAIVLGAMGGMSAAVASQWLGGNIASDAGVVAGAAAIGGVMMSGQGRLGARQGALVLGLAALGGVVMRNVVD